MFSYSVISWSILESSCVYPLPGSLCKMYLFIKTKYSWPNSLKVLLFHRDWNAKILYFMLREKAVGLAKSIRKRFCVVNGLKFSINFEGADKIQKGFHLYNLKITEVFKIVLWGFVMGARRHRFTLCGLSCWYYSPLPLNILST